MPKNYKEKEKFKDMIRSGILRNEEHVPKFEENFEEGIKNVNNSIIQTKVIMLVSYYIYDKSKSIACIFHSVSLF